MQTDTPDAGGREVRLYAVVAVAITLALFFLVPIFRKSPAPHGPQGPGIVPVRIMAAGVEEVNAAAVAPKSAVFVRAIARSKASGPSRPMTPPKDLSNQAGGVQAFSAEDQAQYEAVLFRHIAKFIRYPSAALHVCPAGTAHIRFLSNREGQLLSIVVEQSSGCTIIDNEAVETVRRAQPLPPVPVILPEQMMVHIPLSFDKG
ncbi:TonB family protein [Rhizomicrobium palustre]|uniref:TonB family protein n=1 Tax=Rhizomicrobium palustre TaxID=189966 RepID=A0A846N0T3_9PROT|nr:TonB family protein [Rhizomicrobium palustre]NIK88951.1 TonB family protein [Rhizomicrobium palustre]